MHAVLGVGCSHGAASAQLQSSHAARCTGLVELNLDMNPLQWDDPDPQPAPGPGGFGGGPGGGNDGPGGGGGGAPFNDFFEWYPDPSRYTAQPATGHDLGAGHHGNVGNHDMPNLMDVLDFPSDPPQETNIGPAAQGGFGFSMLAPACGNGMNS